MTEIGFQPQITETHVERVGIIRHRHEFGGGGLVGRPAVEKPCVRVFAELPPGHQAGRKTPLEIVVGYVNQVLYRRIVPAGIVVRLRGHGREARLGAGFPLLVHEIETDLLTGAFVDHLVGINGISLVQDIVPGILVGFRLAPGHAIVGLYIEISPERFGVGSPGEEGCVVGHLSDGLVNPFQIFPSRIAVHHYIGYIPAVQFVMAEAVASHQGEGAPGNAQPLAEEGETAGSDIPVVSPIVAFPPVGGIRSGSVQAVREGMVSAALVETASAPVYTGFEEH